MNMLNKRTIVMGLWVMVGLYPGLSWAASTDDPLLFNVMVNELESNDSGATPLTWDAQAWLGHDLKKLWFKTEGERTQGDTKEVEVQALYSQAFSPFWDFQIGLRHDAKPSPSQDWAVIGLQGLAPYFFEIDAALFVGESGNSGLRLNVEYDWLFTQKIILTPEVEMNFYGQNIPQVSLGSGLSDITLGLRLRYEIRREIAPYVGLEWSKFYGNSADFASRDGLEVSDTKVVAGLRMWF
ncbi:MAG: copper resistance protein CopB [SAR86 cluster bacterium]|uniref:Copper resistance protein CopB n=1 Tax=SAR86 cluster bacterium TaxID=2030880 RepID=A0A2A5C9U2_9GAMM|nr:copper resistance protein B [bacterium AH-315-I11]MBN4075729.1 copper resistance protein B [Gammaproteobacteria bacterium AH-315-E17]PCJ40136.1 MAG: copper resistance protein CopB [SAR86 cluster bacterium]